MLQNVTVTTYQSIEATPTLTPTSVVTSPPVSNNVIAQAIIGTWRATNGNIIEFRPDGSLLINGDTYQYTLDGNMLTASNPFGSQFSEINESVTDTTLTVRDTQGNDGQLRKSQQCAHFVTDSYEFRLTNHHSERVQQICLILVCS